MPTITSGTTEVTTEELQEQQEQTSIREETTEAIGGSYTHFGRPGLPGTSGPGSQERGGTTRGGGGGTEAPRSISERTGTTRTGGGGGTSPDDPATRPSGTREATRSVQPSPGPRRPPAEEFNRPGRGDFFRRRRAAGDEVNRTQRPGPRGPPRDILAFLRELLRGEGPGLLLLQQLRGEETGQQPGGPEGRTLPGAARGRGSDGSPDTGAAPRPSIPRQAARVVRENPAPAAAAAGGTFLALEAIGVTNLTPFFV